MLMRRFLVDLALLKKQFQVPALQTYLSRANLNMVGPTITYYTLLSLVPVLMSVGAIAGLVGINAQELNSMLREQLPKNIMSILGPIITSVLSGGVGILSFSIVITIWGASSVLAVIRKAFNAVHDVPERVSGMLTRVFSFLWLMVILLTAGVLMGASAMMPAIIAALPFDMPWLDTLAKQSWLFALFGLWVLMCVFNFALPAKRLPWKALVAGSGIEVLLLLALNAGFSFYAQFAVKSVGFYQSLGSLLVLMVYLNLVGTIMVVAQILIAWFADLFAAHGTRYAYVPEQAKGVAAKRRSPLSQRQITKHQPRSRR
jgi:membrane protein